MVDPRPLQLRRYRRRLQYGLYGRNAVLSAMNDRVVDGDAVAPGHLRCFFTSEVIAWAAGEGALDWQRLTREGAEMRWTEKGVKGKEWAGFYAPGGLWAKRNGVDEVAHAAALRGIGDEADEQNEVTTPEAALRVLRGAKLIVGMHPDQAAGDIVDFALRMGIPFALTPCCVYGKSFATRRLRSGEPVRSYDDLCRWLLEKHPEAKMATLDFEGKNRVVYLPAAALPPSRRSNLTH